jgi:glycosyltransferase involved in cell wall biosynthesis
VIAHVFSSFAVGGAEVRFAALASRFSARWRHAVIALDGRTDCAERIGKDVPLTLLPAPVRKDQGILPRLGAIHGILRRLAPAVLVTSNWGSIEWAMAARTLPGLRHIHTEDGFGPDEAAGQKGRRILARRMVLRRSEVVLPSRSLLRIARDVWRLPERRLHYIPNGLDLRRFSPRGPAASIDMPGDGPLIGTVAKLRPEKNLGRLLEAVALLRDQGVTCRLLLVGDGPDRTALEKQAADLGMAETARFIGHVSDPAALYRVLDVFALSSDTEQMPFSVMEAMATGLPIASTDVGDVRAMLPPEQAPHLAGLHAEALAAALRPLLEDAAIRAQLGAANRAKAEATFSDETMFQAYARLIEGPTG